MFELSCKPLEDIHSFTTGRGSLPCILSEIYEYQRHSLVKILLVQYYF